MAAFLVRHKDKTYFIDEVAYGFTAVFQLAKTLGYDFVDTREFIVKPIDRFVSIYGDYFDKKHGFEACEPDCDDTDPVCVSVMGPEGIVSFVQEYGLKDTVKIFKNEKEKERYMKYVRLQYIA